MKKLPIGIQTFSKMRNDDYAYADKTRIISELVDSGSYYFLSRPRRFGKSLLLDTLKELFKGSKKLFEGLSIYDKWDWTEKYPVIKISFGSGDFSSEEQIKHAVVKDLQFQASLYDIDSGLATNLENLVLTLRKKYSSKVVILIDEYDKPILDNITDPERAKIARALLRDFYGSIKDLDEYLKFVFITGVSKFSKMNLFSGLNNLEDITISPKFAEIAGYTQNDLETVFAEHLENADKEMVKRWYNGYNYFGEPLYNPFDILLFISNDLEFQNYWWESGNPSFLIEKLKEQKFHVPDFENLEVSKEILNMFDIERIDIIALLWQTGYLTFDSKVNLAGRILYKMKIPNLEVRTSLNELILRYFTDLSSETARSEIAAYKSIVNNDPVGFKNILHALFVAIPYNDYVKNNIECFEGYYAAVVYSFVSALGFDIVGEDVTNKGRIDLTIKASASFFIIEFKVDTDEPAIEQIKKRKYYEKYRNTGKPICILGFNFSSEDRSIKEFQWENID